MYRAVYACAISILGFFSLSVSVAIAQTNFTIVTTYQLQDEIYRGGDIVSFNAESGTHFISRIPYDQQMFGVVQDEPLVVFRREEERVPVAQFGEVEVNVTSVNGEIRVGDFITSSPIPGKGQRFDRDDGDYILGIALESFDGTATGTATTTVSYEDSEYIVGSIIVLLDVGPFTENLLTDLSPPSVIVNEEDTGDQGPKLGTVFRYILATLFAAVSLYIVFRNFGPTLTEGVASVGRNPLAKSTIQSMVTFNMILILVISITSLLVSLVIILLPL